MAENAKWQQKSDKESDKAYTSLAIKYRPKLLRHVIGQEAAVKIVQGMIKTGKIPRTILIEGPYGTGKTTLAKLILRYINCQHDEGPDECEGCASCKAWIKDQHPDIHEKDAGTFRGIDDVREIQKVAGFLPRYHRRGYIMDECHALTKDAWNASLKLFEQPPGKSMFIMCTTDAHKIPDTIQSRSLRIKLEPISDENITKLIRRVAEKERIKDFPKEAAKMIAEAAMGHPRNALSLFEQVTLYMENEGADIKDLKKQLPEIVKSVLGLPPEQVVIKYISAILNKDLETAIGLMPEVQNAPVFLGLCTNLLRQHIFYHVARKAMDGRYLRMASSNGRALEKYWSHTRLTELLALVLTTYERAKAYILPERELLDLMTLKAVSLAR